MFPFTDSFTGCGWNCRSLYAYDELDTIHHLGELTAQHDFVGVSETRETLERKTTLGHHLQTNHKYYTSYIDQYKSGIGLVVKRSFLQNFTGHEWHVIVKGRLAVLELTGLKGSLHIFTIYLDPSSKQKKQDVIKALGSRLDGRVHSLIIGDFNFVHNQHDRYSKAEGTWSNIDDQAVAKVWREHITARGIEEWQQPEFTCETGLVFSRIDRVYSSLHAIHNLADLIYCAVLSRRSQLSDHWPISFGLRHGGKGNRSSIPSWVVNHPLFGEEVFAEYQYRVQGRTMDALSALHCFKEAAKTACKYIRGVSREHPATTIEERISASMGFMRALKCGDAVSAQRFQRIYFRLQDVQVSPTVFSSPEFRSLQDHVLELAHTSVKERIDHLKAVREELPDFIYSQRKENILRSLKRMLPGSSGRVCAVKDPKTQSVSTDAVDISRILTEHWQRVFDEKTTDGELRQRWLRRLTDRLDLSFEDLLPTEEDVKLVLDHLPSSSNGPDGIPFAVFKRFRELVAPIFLDIARGMAQGRLTPGEDFNFAFLVCLPKGDGEPMGDLNVHEPSSTRPLSIVDASNRILASIFRVSLERNAASWVSRAQRGFLPGRQMLRNILDIDFAAQKISVKSKKGAIVLFDFRAAFPSMSHEFIWDTLLAIGLPGQYISALKLFYFNNKHFFQVDGKLLESVTVYSGVRQGCPLSPLLFALCADILLREIAGALGGEDLVRAFADDTGVVIEDFEATLPKLHMLFEEFERISALAINVQKTLFIPLWATDTMTTMSNKLRRACPEWGDFAVKSFGKYLGFMIGPGARGASWTKPLDKFVKRARQWATLHLGLFYNITIFRPFVSSVLAFIMQLEPLPDELGAKYEEVLRRLAPGPGNWVTINDLTHLHADYFFPVEFPNLHWTAQAAKLRVIDKLARDCHRKRSELEEWQSRNLHRPFGGWHGQSFFAQLAQLETNLKERGITREIIRELSNTGNISFQGAAEKMIKRRCSETYYAESRLRQKMTRWHLVGVPRHLEDRVLRNFKLLSTQCQPRVLAAYFRALWNGWCTSRRMRTMAGHSGTVLPCVLCGKGQDSLEHYSLCEVFWEFCNKDRPQGLGIHLSLRSRETFFLVRPRMADEDKIRMALGIYALFRSVIYCSSEASARPKLMTMLRLWAKRATDGSNARLLLMH